MVRSTWIILEYSDYLDNEKRELTFKEDGKGLYQEAARGCI
jgi:hypothetical protein